MRSPGETSPAEGWHAVALAAEEHHRAARERFWLRDGRVLQMKSRSSSASSCLFSPLHGRREDKNFLQHAAHTCTRYAGVNLNARQGAGCGMRRRPWQKPGSPSRSVGSACRPGPGHLCLCNSMTLGSRPKFNSIGPVVALSHTCIDEFELSLIRIMRRHALRQCNVSANRTIPRRKQKRLPAGSRY